jgi:hypothetical protein
MRLLLDLPTTRQEYQAQARRRLKAAYVQAKMDLLKLHQKHHNRESGAAFAISQVRGCLLHEPGPWHIRRQPLARG